VDPVGTGATLGPAPVPEGDQDLPAIARIAAAAAPTLGAAGRVGVGVREDGEAEVAGPRREGRLDATAAGVSGVTLASAYSSRERARISSTVWAGFVGVCVGAGSSATFATGAEVTRVGADATVRRR